MLWGWSRRKCAKPSPFWVICLRAFLRLEVYRLQTGVSWYETKAAILREAICRYLAHPRYVLQPTA